MTFSTVDLTPEQREELHRISEQRIKTFRYEKPELHGKPKRIEALVYGRESKELNVLVQIVGDGGENNMHYHTNSETAWMVLRGHARFHGVNGVLAELGPMQGIFLPGGCRYWFEKVGEGDLEILQMVGLEGTDDDERINVEAHKAWMVGDSELTKYEETASSK
jgi:mannose-6-phosphate isomerase-like protein (cupin superfamily)